MKIKNVFILTCLTVTSSLSFAQSQVVTVQANKNWQTFIFEQPVNSITSITGGWSVDGANYTVVSSNGHIGDSAKSLKPFEDYKFDKKYPFGRLLGFLPYPGHHGHMDIIGPMVFENSFTEIRLRINDSKEALGDNTGSLTITFE